MTPGEAIRPATPTAKGRDGAAGLGSVAWALVLFVALTVAFAWAPRPMGPPGPLPALAPALAPAISLTFVAAAALVLPLGGVVFRALTLMLAALALLTLTDGFYQAFFGRPIALATDAQVLPRTIRTLVRGFPVKGPFILGAILLAFVVTLYAVRHLLRLLCRIGRDHGALRSLGGLALACATLATASASGGGPWFTLRPTDVVGRQVTTSVDYLRERDAIRAALQDDPLPDATVTGGDIHLLFIESFGTFVFDEMEAQEDLAQGLADLSRRIETAGFGIVSRAVEAPIIGGRSWLAHGTVLSGVMLRNDAYLPLLSDSARTTLVDRMNENGYRTMAVGPSLRRPWNEGGFFDFDTVRNFWDLDYRGPAFGPLQVPDQATLRRAADFIAEREGKGDRPTFLVLPLISSHWPWDVLPGFEEDWQAIGRGEGLRIAREAEGQTMEDGAMPPLYLPSVLYSLKAAVQYAAQVAGEDDLVILVGDHPPAPFVTGDRTTRGVPVHILARDADTLDRWRAFGFTDGLRPGKGPLEPQSRLPFWLLEAMSQAGPAG